MTILQLITKLQQIAEARSYQMKVIIDDGFEPNPILKRADFSYDHGNIVIEKDEEYVEL